MNLEAEDYFQDSLSSVFRDIVVCHGDQGEDFVFRSNRFGSVISMGTTKLTTMTGNYAYGLHGQRHGTIHCSLLVRLVVCLGFSC